MKERKKKFSKDQEDIADIWEDIWTRLLKIADSSLSEAGWKKEEFGKYWVKAWLKQPHETKKGEEKEEKGYRAYIYYKNGISENLKNLIDSEFTSSNGWEWGIIKEDKIEEISKLLCANTACGNCCEKEELQQKAQIVDNPPPMVNPNK